MQKDLSDVRKVLIVRWGALGDLALCSAVFEDIYQQLPGTELHLNVDAVWSGMFEADHRFSKIITDQFRGVGFFVAIKNWLALLRRERYDLIVDLQCNDRSRLLMSVAVLLGIAPRYRAGTQAILPYNLVPGVNTSKMTIRAMHSFELYRLALDALGLEKNCDQPRLIFDEASEKSALALLNAFNIKTNAYYVFVPGSSLSGKNKRWGIGNYSKLAEMIIDEKKIDKVVVLGSDAEKKECQLICDAVGNDVVNLAGKTQLDMLPTIFENSLGVISNDTGLAHIAAGSSKPVVVICGPTNAERVKPAGPNVRTLQAPIDCFDKHLQEYCMNHVSPESVLKKLGI